MATRNIEMNYFNGSSYDQLYPNTVMSNVSDWGNYVYSKSEVDGSIGEINAKLNNGLKGVAPWTLFQSKKVTQSITVKEQSNIEDKLLEQIFAGNYVADTEDVIMTLSFNISVSNGAGMNGNNIILQLKLSESDRLGSPYFFYKTIETVENTVIADRQENYPEVVFWYSILLSNILRVSNNSNTWKPTKKDKHYIIGEEDGNLSNLNYLGIDRNEPLYLRYGVTSQNAVATFNLELTFNIYKRPSIYLL